MENPRQATTEWKGRAVQIAELQRQAKELRDLLKKEKGPVGESQQSLDGIGEESEADFPGAVPTPLSRQRKGGCGDDLMSQAGYSMVSNAKSNRVIGMKAEERRARSVVRGRRPGLEAHGDGG